MINRLPRWHRWLRERGATLKIALAAVVIGALFPLGVSERTLEAHALRLLFMVPILCVICFLVVGRTTFKTMLVGWLFGLIPYAVFAIPLTLSGVNLTPHMALHSGSSRWLYTGLFPPRMLGIFAAGTILFAILSPTNFLKLGRVGVGMTVVLRAFEFAEQQLASAIDTLRLQGNWPDSGMKRRKRPALIILVKGCVIIVIVCLRNAILWSPWAYLSFKAIDKQLWRKSQ